MFQHVPTVHQTALDLQALRGRAGRISGKIELKWIKLWIKSSHQSYNQRKVCLNMFNRSEQNLNRNIDIFSEHKNVQDLSQQCQPVDHHSSAPGIETDGQKSKEPNEIPTRSQRNQWRKRWVHIVHWSENAINGETMRNIWTYLQKNQLLESHFFSKLWWHNSFQNYLHAMIHS
jgi:hypothetical protein